MNFTERNERIYGNQSCSAGAACKYHSNKPREQIPLKNFAHDKYGAMSKLRDSVIGIGHKCRTSSSSWEYGNFTPGKLCANHNSGTQFSSNSDKAVSPYQVSCQHYDGSNMTVCSYGNCPSAYHHHTHHTMSPMSTFRSSVYRDDSSVAAASITALSSIDDQKSEKSDEFVYAAPDNKNRVYECLPTKSTTVRRRTESENLDTFSPEPPFETNNYSYSFAKHKTESDLSVETHHGKFHQRVDLLTPQSAPDLQTIMSSPYDIKFLNECVKAYIRNNGEDDVEIDILAKIQTVEKSKTTSPNWNSNNSGADSQRSILYEIFRMTPVVLFWTSCAFLVALIYIIIFSCDLDDHE